ncbi:transglycosylase SLT domain-containing protein [Streptomyces sp. NPDC056987]|uniref:transglycosylase SLT domain-containing protein n=1 Tax=Streptomyces sp. NPDC056987 TaxID=3345988 RepID=UPI00362A5BD8
MPRNAKHRRPRTGSLARRLVAVGTGGAALAIPLVTAATAQAAPATVEHVRAAKAAEAPAATPKTAATTYVVVEGDSLSKIAQAHSVSGGWQKLYEDNRSAVGANPSLVHPGLKLTVNGKKAAAPATTATETSTKTSTESAGTGSVEPAVAKTYTDNLDGWIREALDVMAQHGIPGSYEGIHRNIMRESSGDPNAINNWDINAQNGVPSKGLLQVIAPTFQAYHVPGTAMDAYDPVANITAACNYAADRYGSIDNVNGPY